MEKIPSSLNPWRARRCLQEQLSLYTGGYWGYAAVMLCIVTASPNPFCRFMLYQSSWKQNIYFFLLLYALLAFGREMHPPKLTVKGINHWVGQIRWIKEEQFIALREVCHLLERWSAVFGAMWHVASLSETALPDRRSHPTFSICSVLSTVLCTDVLHGSLQKSCLSHAHYQVKICLPDR